MTRLHEIYDELERIFGEDLLFDRDNTNDEYYLWKECGKCLNETLLKGILDFAGTYNFDDTTIYHVLSSINEARDVKGKTVEQALVSILNEPWHYINLMLCVLDENDLVEYGSCLQNCWLSDLGKKIIQTRELDLERLKLVDGFSDE